jgi:hypothetical protein
MAGRLPWFPHERQAEEAEVSNTAVWTWILAGCLGVWLLVVMSAVWVLT